MTRSNGHTLRIACAGLLAAVPLMFATIESAWAASVVVPCSVPALVSAIHTANTTPAADTLNLAIDCTYKLVAADSSAVGGGMRNRGTASLTRVVASGNSTGSGAAARGGGIRNSGGAGPLVLTQSVVTHNTASGATSVGGGISDGTVPSTVVLTRTQIFGNSPDNCNPLIERATDGR